MKIEKQLIQSINKGNKKAFEVLFRTYYSRLCAYSLSFVSKNDVAEDIVTELFMRIWEKRESLLVKDSVSSYLFQSVKNSSINYLTREKSRTKLLSENDRALLQLKIDFPVSDKIPISDLINQELEEKIKIEIEKLPTQCKEIFYLSRFEELSHKEIAKKLDISENTVKVQVYRALVKLRTGLKDYLPVIIMQFPNIF